MKRLSRGIKMEQESLFETATSRQVFWSNWKPFLVAECEALGYPSSCISSREIKGGRTSVLFLSTVIAQICTNKSSQYVSVQLPAVDGMQGVSATKSGYRMDLSTALRSNIVSTIIKAAIKSTPKSYDCCAYYMACSDAKHCVNSSASAFGCGYRKVLADGRVFYGENRNIDR